MFGCLAVKSVGLSGGILTIWLKLILTLSCIGRSSNWLWSEGLSSEGVKFSLINVYGSNELRDKIKLRHELHEIVLQIDKTPICLMGDFNSIGSLKERVGCIYNKRDIELFNSFIEDLHLLEVVGDLAFTWFGPKNRKSKLDRVLVNDLWLKCCSWRVSGWHRRNSDHSPFYFSSDMRNWGPKPFKAFDIWLINEKVQQLISTIVNEPPNSSWFSCLKDIKLKLKNWVGYHRVCNSSRIKELECKLQLLDNVSADVSEKIKVFDELQGLYHSENLQLKQKARLQWDIEGDSTSRFFHMAIKRRQ